MRVRYGPYEHLNGPFSFKHRNLFESFTSGDYVYLLNSLLSAPPQNQLITRMRADKAKSDAANKKEGNLPESETNMDEPLAGRGCGFDLNKTSISQDGDNIHVLEFFSLHDPEERQLLEDKWMPLDWPWKLPVNGIMEYLGKEVAFYFAFLKQLTSGLLFLSPLGIAAQICAVFGWSWGWKPQYVQSVSAVVGVFAFAVILDSWRCEQSRCAHLWGCYGFKGSVSLRPEHIKASIIGSDPATGKLSYRFPLESRRRASRLSFCVTVFAGFLLLSGVASIFLLKDYVIKTNAPRAVKILPEFLNAALITLFKRFSVIAELLTSMENYSTVAE